MANEICFLKKFFDGCKVKIKSPDVLVCIGNESCDPDSFISSIAVAVHEKCIMAVCMNRKIFEAKGELMVICKLFSIDLDDLIFIERPKGKFSLKARILGTVFKVGNEEYKLEDKNVKLIIADHHKPIEELRHCKLEMIIDHHTLTETALSAKRIYVDTDVGSCCTLISKFIGHSLISSRENKNDYFEDNEFCKNLSKMLAIPIFFDTNRFRKVTSHFDKGEFRKLIFKASVKKKEIKKVVKKMKRERKNDSTLDNETILLKDFKKFDHDGLVFGYATVKYPFEEWIDREASKMKGGSEKNNGIYLEMVLSEFRREYGLDFLFVNRKFKDNRYLICVNCPIEKLLAKAAEFKSVAYKGFQYYETDPLNSRKILAPIVKDLIHKLNIDDNKD